MTEETYKGKKSKLVDRELPRRAEIIADQLKDAGYPGREFSKDFRTVGRLYDQIVRRIHRINVQTKVPRPPHMNDLDFRQYVCTSIGKELVQKLVGMKLCEVRFEELPDGDLKIKLDTCYLKVRPEEAVE